MGDRPTWGNVEHPLSRPGLGQRPVLGRAPSASLPAVQGPACSRYVTSPAPSQGVHPGAAAACAADMGPPAGMGSQSRPQSALQGFGYSKGQGHTGERCAGPWGAGRGRLLAWPRAGRALGSEPGAHVLTALPSSLPGSAGGQGRCHWVHLTNSGKPRRGSVPSSGPQPLGPLKGQL